MRESPRPPGLRPGGAADFEDGQERRLLNLSHVKSQERLRVRRQHLARQLHRLGARATAEFIAELAERFGSGVDDRLAEYVRRLSPKMLAAVGGDGFPPPPLRAVGGRQ